MRVSRARIDLDAEIVAMVARVRQVFGEEILASIYDRARNAAIRQVRRSNPLPSVPDEGMPRPVASAGDDGFVLALRDELDRALTHH